MKNFRLTKPAIVRDQPEDSKPDPTQVLVTIYAVLRNYPEVLAAVENALATR